MIAFNNSVGFVFFNCPRTFLIYLGISTGIKLDFLVSLLKSSKVDIVSSEVSSVFVQFIRKQQNIFEAP